jgi:hypothetical protein
MSPLLPVFDFRDSGFHDTEFRANQPIRTAVRSNLQNVCGCKLGGGSTFSAKMRAVLYSVGLILNGSSPTKIAVMAIQAVAVVMSDLMAI